MTSNANDDEDINHPTIEITFGDHGRVKAQAVIDVQLLGSLVRDADAVASVAAGEFVDVQEELKEMVDDTDRAKDRAIYPSVAAFPGDREGDVVFQGTLTIEWTKCDATDPPCNDVVGSIIDDAIDELRRHMRDELTAYGG